jgi:hypothetical protein
VNGRFPPIVSKLAALALCVLVAGLLTIGLVRPLWGHVSELRAEIDRQRELLGRFLTYAANEKTAEAEAARLETAKQSGIFLAGDTDALRTAGLQGLVRSIAEARGIRLASARGMPVQERDGLRLIGLQAEFESDLQQLQAVLLELEGSRPHLLLQSVQVAPVSGYRSEDDRLRVRLGVAAAAIEEAKP